MYAVDGGDTAELAGVMQKLGLAAKGVKAGGFDLTEKTQKLLHEGYIEFTIDQQPYLQGFLPIVQLFLWQVSGSLTGPAEVDTGLKFIDKETVTPYVNSKSRFEGTSSEAEGGPDPGGHRRLAAMAQPWPAWAAGCTSARDRPAPGTDATGCEARRSTRRASLPRRGRRCSSACSSLREGSIIVVTLLVAIYFSLSTSTFLTSANFKTLLPFFAPFAILGAGEVFVMILGEIDLSIGATYLLAPFLYYKLAPPPGSRTCRACSSRWPAAWPSASINGVLHGGRRHQLVRDHARHAVHAGGADAGHLPCRAGRDARRGSDEHAGRASRT